ncbi:putative nuclease HARBI1 isoform X2 [Ixodes scapularis]
MTFRFVPKLFFSLERLYREHRDAFELPEEIFRKQYRLPKIVVRWLCDELREEPELQRHGGERRTRSAGPKDSQRCGPRRVRRYRASSRGPATPSERFDAEKGFRLLGRIPGVIGCVDGTMVSIVGPSKNDPTVTKAAYWCRKYFYALNVMVVCDADCRIMCIDPRYPGSVHDSFMWQFSWLRNQLEQGQLPRDGRFLLGLLPGRLLPFTSPLRPRWRRTPRAACLGLPQLVSAGGRRSSVFFGAAAFTTAWLPPTAGQLVPRHLGPAASARCL